MVTVTATVPGPGSLRTARPPDSRLFFFEMENLFIILRLAAEEA